MEDEKITEQLKNVIAQQNKLIASCNIYIDDVNVLCSLQKDYIETLEEQVKYYQLLKSSLWN